MKRTPYRGFFIVKEIEDDQPHWTVYDDNGYRGGGPSLKWAKEVVDTLIILDKAQELGLR